MDATVAQTAGRNRPLQSQTHVEPARVQNVSQGFLSTTNRNRQQLLSVRTSGEGESALVNPSIGLHSALGFQPRVGPANLNEPSDKSVINVHQHFNQPNIMNFNHNDYFDKGKNLDDSLRDAFYPSNAAGEEPADSESSTIQRGTTAIIQNRRRIVSSINPGASKNNKSQFYKQLQPFLRASST